MEREEQVIKEVDQVVAAAVPHIREEEVCQGFRLFFSLSRGPIRSNRAPSSEWVSIFEDRDNFFLSPSLFGRGRVPNKEHNLIFLNR